MQITNNMKAGYQGKPDAMRAKAEKLLNHPGSSKDTYFSKSCADKEKIRPYKEGGKVTMHDNKDCTKFAMGGVGKIRLGQATKSGKPKK